jgi:uncharacterized membrane protein YbaN (DUF454 family)
MKKHLLIAAGLLSLALGIVGIFLPLLPTTCFLLLATYFFARSSPRLHAWLLNHRVLGRRIRLYIEHKSVTKNTKIVALATLWSSIILSIVLVDWLVVRAILLLVAIGVSAHLLLLRTYRPEENTTEENIREAERTATIP